MKQNTIEKTNDDTDGSQHRRLFDSRVFRYAGLLAGGIALGITLSGKIDAGVQVKTFEFATTLLVCSNKLDEKHRKAIKQSGDKSKQ